MLLKIQCLQDFLSYIKAISSVKSIYLYGSGYYGQIFGEWFDKNGISWEGYVDSDPQKNGTKLRNKIVYLPQKIFDKKNTCFVITTGMNTRNVIARFLDDNNCEYVYVDSNSLVHEMNYVIKNPSQVKINKIKKFKGAYNNSRCFIVGNGPSLTIDDLNRIANEYSFATNSVCNIWSDTIWRPTFYLVNDIVFGQTLIKEQGFDYLTKELENVLCNYIQPFFNEYQDKNNVFFYRSLFNNYGLPDFSEDISKGVYESSTTVYLMYQFAAYMGFNEIYLIGMDFNFKNVINKDGIKTTNDTVKDHADMLNGNSNGVYHIDDILNCHIAAKQYADEHGIKIYNATRGGKLEVFPRVDFDSLF